VSLSTKTLIIVVLVFCGLYLGLYFPTHIIITDSFANEQKRQATEDMQRVASVLSIDLEGLDNITSDWANWNDTYQFVETPYDEYIKSNLAPLSFIHNRLNVIIYIQPSGYIVWGKSYDPLSNELVAIPDSLKEYISANSILLGHQDVVSKVTGFISLPEGTMLISSHPILTTDGQGPIRGTLIFGRYLDSKEIDMLSKTTVLPIKTSQFGDIPLNLQSALSATSGDYGIVVKRDGSRSLGYVLVKDIFSKPSIVLKTDMPATIYNKGQDSVFYFLIGRTIAFVLFSVVILILLNRFIISRLARLKTTVSEITISGDPKSRVSLKGKDELATLAGSINEMLDSMEWANAERSQAEQMFITLADSSPVSIFIIQNNRFQYVNPQFQKDTGYSEAELLAANPLDYILPEDRKMAREKSIKMLEGEVVSPHEYRVVKKGGEIRWALQSVTYIKYRGQPAILGNRMDITEHKRTEEALRQSEEKLRVMFQAVGEGIALADMNGNILEMNDAAVIQCGYTKKEIIGLNGYKVLSPKDVTKALEDAKRITKQELESAGIGASIFEYSIVRKDGTEFVGEVGVSFIKDESGKPVTAICVIRDVTERKRMEEALRQSEEKYRLLISNIPDAVWTMDVNGNLIFVSTNIENITGFPTDTYYRSGFRIWLDNMHPDDAEIARGSLKLLFERQVPLDFECRIKRKDGQWIWIHQRAVNTYQKEGVLYVDGVCSDITQRKQVEETRVQSAAANARADELRQSRRRLVTAEESMRRDIAQQLHGSVQNRLIVLLLRLTELERTPSAVVSSSELVDIRQKLEELLETQVRPISHRLYPSILRQGLIPALQSLGDQFETVMAVELKLDEDLIKHERENRQLIPEPIRLSVYRIVEEALTNVVKHAKATKVAIELGLDNKGRLRLMVQDNGLGFDSDSTSGNVGMLMMHDYAEVSGGDCVIRSAPGRGTEVTATFTFAEPVAEPREKAAS
jgi:PAS domain S-box-containing protein